MSKLWIPVSVTLLLATACGDDAAGGDAQDAGTSQEAGRRDVALLTDVGASEDLSTDSAATVSDTGTTEDTSAPEPDLGAATDMGVADTASQADTQVADTSSIEDDAATSTDLPVATNDCGELAIATHWAGTFDGVIDSNIPDFGGYTFEGPVNGDVAFEIRCVDSKLRVFGALNGHSTNCTLDSGCPFTARMDGEYDSETQRIEGVLLDAVIDYTAVQVYAEGTFSGTLSDATLTGVWDGTKTGISNTALSWVDASGSGTWEASPAPM